MAGAKFRYYSGPEKQKSPDRLFRSGDYPFYHQNPAGALLSSKYRPNMQAGLLTSPTLSAPSHLSIGNSGVILLKEFPL